MCWHIIHTLPIVFPINWMSSFSTRTLHQEYNYVVLISVSKKVATQVLFKGRKLLVPVWLITFPYSYLTISNHVLVSYMTSLLAFIPTTSYYLLNLWLLPHNQINMTFYYVSVCIQKLKSFELIQASNLYHIQWYAFNNIIMWFYIITLAEEILT